jgi:hypothetical protein
MHRQIPAGRRHTDPRSHEFARYAELGQDLGPATPYSKELSPSRICDQSDQYGGLNLAMAPRRRGILFGLENLVNFAFRYCVSPNSVAQRGTGVDHAARDSYVERLCDGRAGGTDRAGGKG